MQEVRYKGRHLTIHLQHLQDRFIGLSCNGPSMSQPMSSALVQDSLKKAGSMYSCIFVCPRALSIFSAYHQLPEF